MAGKILIVTTVPETMLTILKGQPEYLSRFFQIVLASGEEVGRNEVVAQEKLETCLVPMVRGIHPVRDAVSIFRMAALIFKVRPSLIHSYTPKAGLVSMLAGWICRTPRRVHTFTGLIFPTTRGFKRLLLIFVDRLICACATHIVPEGNGVKRDLEAFKITAKSLSVIGHGNIAGVDTEYFSPLKLDVSARGERLRRELKIPDSSRVFCFVGRLNKDKGIGELVSAFIKLPSDARLILVGALDKTAPVDNKTLGEIELHPRIHLLGFLKDIRPALFIADLLVLPSYREGFPNVVLQAGAMNLPVIATNINGCNEIVEPGFNGWLVPAKNPQALNLAMQESLSMSRFDLKKMGERARARVQDRFERSDHWGRMVHFYRSLLSFDRKPVQ
ncbi:glycosyltransferase family 4 protein [Acidovorax cavernicola]|nr:glycosyltransferase family 4 protein [Acidovorax cavernicola]